MGEHITRTHEEVTAMWEARRKRHNEYRTIPPTIDEAIKDLEDYAKDEAPDESVDLAIKALRMMKEIKTDYERPC